MFAVLFNGCAKPNAAQTTKTVHCTISISCNAVIGNKQLNPAKADFIPSDGRILVQTETECAAGETVYDVLRCACESHACSDNCRFCQNGGIQMEAAYTPAYGTYYVEGIHNLYEKDCGGRSGWLYTVNGETASKGCSETIVQDGDVIEWVYTTDWNM